MLKTSDVRAGGEYHAYLMKDGVPELVKPEMVLTKTDYDLICEHYNLYDTEYVDYIWFEQRIGMFDSYIDKWMQVKANSEGSERAWAKLFLNNLYGKFAMNTNSSFKVADFSQGVLRFRPVEQWDKKPGYIPAGAAVTSYARAFTVRAAQANYDSFIYADTDSLHLSHQDAPISCPIHDSMLCTWKQEAFWAEGIFERSKSYIEVTEKEDEGARKKYYNIKCAGMGKRCNYLVQLALKKVRCYNNRKGIYAVEGDEIIKLKSVEEYDFVSKGMELTDFTTGLKVPGNLKGRLIRGGTLLCSEYYVMR